MILVLLGTQHNEFKRLINEVENNIKSGVIKEEVIVQSGFTKYESNLMKIIDMIPKEEMEQLKDKASYIITHGGVGSIVSSVEKGKKVIAIPRYSKYGEHVNDHQTDIVRAFNDKGYIIGINEVEELESAIKKLESFTPNKYNSNSNKLTSIIEEYIDNLDVSNKKE